MAPGDCSSVCVCCGRRVVVPPMAGIGPELRHEDDCPRKDWPIVDACTDEEGRLETYARFHSTDREAA